MLKKKNRIVKLLLSCCCVTFFLFNNAQNINFQNIDIDDGLSQSSINCIIQDRFGFIWIGTQDGLNKYDGYEFSWYKNDPFDTTTLSNNFVSSVCEDSNGDLWVGTEDGLNRLNRSTQTFDRYKYDVGGLSGKVVHDITADENGSIWIGTEKGLNKFNPKTGHWRYYKHSFEPNSLPSDLIQTLFFDSKKQLWVGTRGGGLARYSKNNDDFVTFQHDSIDDYSISNNIIWDIQESSDGFIWIGTNEGLNKLDQSSGSVVFYHYLKDAKNPLSLSTDNIVAIIPGQSGNIWVGTAVSGLNKLIYSDNSAVFFNYKHNHYDSYSLINNLVQCMFIDCSGSIWIGTNKGISKFDPLKQGFNHLYATNTQKDSISEGSVWCIEEDKNEVLWVGTMAGITRIDRLINDYQYFPHIGNNPMRKNNNSILSLYIDDDEVIWVGAIDGLFILHVSEDLSKWFYEPIAYRSNNSIYSDNRVYQIIEDKKGFLWIATREGLGRLNKADLSFQFFENDPKNSNSLSNNIVRCVYEDNQERIWVGTDGGGLNKVEFNGADIYFSSYKNNPQDNKSISNNMIFSMYQDKINKLWLGTYGGGINCMDIQTGKFEHFLEKDGLSNNVVYGILSDEKNNLWLSTNRGLSELNITTKKISVFGENDGLQSNEFNTGAYFKSKKGELFFGGIDGFNAYYAKDIKSNLIPPMVHITEVDLFGKPLLPGSIKSLKKPIIDTRKLVLSHKQNNLTIKFVAFHYSYSKKNRYKYIMEGLNNDTIHFTSDRLVYYTNLDPGEYVFKVWGANSDGIWEKFPEILKITIAPPLWKTWWFRILFVLFVTGSAFSIYKYRINIIKRQKQYLEKVVAERTLKVRQQNEKIEAQKEALSVEKEKVDKLLLNILPEDTADELKTIGKASARSFRLTTVMFTDICNFTKIAEDSNPVELVARLDGYFVKFDEIIEKYGVEKIKTVGDAYLCAGGVPIRNKSNPIDTVLAGLEIQRYMRSTYEKLGDDVWKVRLGIHTGEVIAGVIGLKRFAYDIWGDTVNVAQRMENSGEVGKVNISGETFNFVAPYFDCTYRGKIAAKNKGQVDMYFVNNIKPELSVEGLGLEPNEQFWKYVNLHLYSSIHYRNAEKHVLKLLKEQLSQDLLYHSVNHMYDVCTAAERLAHLDGIVGEDLFLLKTAALYHDAGFVKQYDKNEPIGMEMAQTLLPKFGYTPDQVSLISDLIRATIFPHNPKSHLEKIMCDADLDYLGRDDFFEISEKLKEELYRHKKITSDIQWDEMQVGFFGLHHYFTDAAIKTRLPQKKEHLKIIKKRLAELKQKQ